MKTKINTRLLKGIKPQSKPYEIVDSEIAGFILRVEPSGHMTYYLRYRLENGGRRRVRLGREDKLTPELARDKAKEKLADVIKDIDPAEEKRAARVETLGAFLEHKYKPTVLDHRKSGVATYARLVNCFKPFFTRKLDDPTLGNAIVKWQSKRIKVGKEKSTVNRDIVALKAALNWAVDREFIKVHPLRKVKLARIDKTPRVRYLGQDEELRLMAALDTREVTIRGGRKNHNKWLRERRTPELQDLSKTAFADYLKPMVILSLSTGMRRGEVFGLEWSDVDLDRAMLTVRAEVAKSSKVRHIPLNDEALAALKGWKGQTNGAGLVFKAKNGGRFDNVKSSWESLLDSEHANITGFRWHDMRHHFASKLVMAGVDLNTVRELLGHADLTMTVRYAHLAPEAKAAAVAKIKIATPDNVIRFEKSRQKNA